MSDVPKKEAVRKPNNGKGRPKGATNRVGRQLKEMILGALDDCGGQAYLTECAQDPKTRAAFLTLLGKVLPSEMRHAGPGGEALPAAVMQPSFHVTLTQEKKT